MSSFKNGGLQIKNKATTPTPDTNATILYTDGTKLKVVGELNDDIVLSSDLASISGSVTTLNSGTGISVVEDTPDSWTISVSGNYVNTIAVSGESNLTGDIKLVSGSGVALSQSGNEITITAIVSGGSFEHNNLALLQGGTTNEYYHLTNAEYSDLIGSTEVASISANLQTQIDNISGGNVDLASLDTRFVNISGDTMTGTLTLSTGDLTVTTGDFEVTNGDTTIGGDLIPLGNQTSNTNVIIGFGANAADGNEIDSVIIGNDAYSDDNYATVIGKSAFSDGGEDSVVVGDYSFANGNNNIALGSAMRVGDDSVANRSIGIGADSIIGEHDDNIGIGYDFYIYGDRSIAIGGRNRNGFTQALASDQIMLGYGASNTGANRMQIGGNRATLAVTGKTGNFTDGESISGSLGASGKAVDNAFNNVLDVQMTSTQDFASGEIITGLSSGHTATINGSPTTYVSDINTVNFNRGVNEVNFQNPIAFNNGIYDETLTPALSGNFLTWNQNGQLVDSGLTIADISGGGSFDQTTADALYVNLTGDTMTGTLTVDNAGDLEVTTGDLLVDSGQMSLNYSGGLSDTFGIFTQPPRLIIEGENDNSIGGVAMKLGSSGNTSEFRFAVFDETSESTAPYIAFSMPASNNTASLFGETRGNIASVFVNRGGRKLCIGTVESTDLVLGTNNTTRMTIGSNGEVTVSDLAGGANGIITVDANGKLQNSGSAVFTSTQTGATSASAVIVDSFDPNTTGERSVKWLVSIQDGTNFRTSEVLAVTNSDGTSSNFNIVSTPDLGTVNVTLSVDTNAGSMRLLATITDGGSWDIKASRLSI